MIDGLGTCIHHWRIEEAGGPTSAGACLNCGLVRQFRNHMEELPYAEYRHMPGMRRTERATDTPRWSQVLG